MKPFNLEGKTVDEKFTFIERVLQRIARRVHRTFVGLIPASPVFGFVADPVAQPTVMQAIFPADGTITKGAMHFGRMKGKAVHIDIRIERGLGSESHTFSIPKKGVVTDLDYKIEAGARMSVSVLDPDETIGDVWIGFMYELDMKSMKQLKIPFDFIEKLTEEVLDATNEEG